MKKKLVAAKTDSISNSPTVIQRIGASWSTTFSFDAIKKAMNSRQFVATVSRSIPVKALSARFTFTALVVTP